MVKKVLSSGYIIRAFIDISNHDRGTWRVSHYHRLSPVFTNPPPPPHQGVFTHLSIIFSACWWIYIRYSVHHIRTISLSICRQSQWINEWICCCNRTASFESNFAQTVKHTQSRKNVGHSDAGVWIPIVGTKMEEPIFFDIFSLHSIPMSEICSFRHWHRNHIKCFGPKISFCQCQNHPFVSWMNWKARSWHLKYVHLHGHNVSRQYYENIHLQCNIII